MNNAKQQRFSFTWCLVLLTMSACTTIPVDERDKVPEEVNQAAAETIAQMVANYPEMQKLLDEAVGYAGGRMSVKKVPFVGGGYVDHSLGSAAASKPDLSFENDVSPMSKWSVFEPPRLAVELQKEGSSRRTWRNQ